MSSTPTTTPVKSTNLLKWVFLAIALILFIVYVKNQYAQVKKKAEVSAVTHMPAPQQAPQAPTEALVLLYEGYTPCSTNIAWRFKIRTDGHPLRIKFQGVNEWFDHPAEGDAKAPSGINEGETFFVSSDPKNPRLRVQVYKKITVGR